MNSKRERKKMSECLTLPSDWPVCAVAFCPLTVAIMWCDYSDFPSAACSGASSDEMLKQSRLHLFKKKRQIQQYANVH